jgi:hypothetical protein
VPADVTTPTAGEEVGDEPFALDHVAEVVADVSGVGLLHQRGARDVDGLDGDGVGLAAQGGSHGTIITNHRVACQVGAPSVSPWVPLGRMGP